MPTIPVPSGSVDLTVSGLFGPAYDVFVTLTWAGDPAVPAATKTPTSFLVNFTVPAPPGAELTYQAVGSVGPAPSFGATTLSGYLSDVRRFLYSSQTDQSLYEESDLVAFINRAMQQRDLDLGLNRSLIRFPMVSGQPRYPIASIVAGGTVIDGSTVPNPINVYSIYYTPVAGPDPGSGYRVPLGRRSYSWISLLLSQSYRSLPQWYAVYSTTTVVLGPVPYTNYYTEWDFMCFNSPLVNLTDADTQPYPWTDPVPFMACAFAKYGAQRYDEAREWERIYQDRLTRVRARGRAIGIQSPLFDYPRGLR